MKTKETKEEREKREKRQKRIVVAKTAAASALFLAATAAKHYGKYLTHKKLDRLVAATEGMARQNRNVVHYPIFLAPQQDMVFNANPQG